MGDVRIKKTSEALVNSLLVLLETQNFRNISVNELCEEALVSRAAFYSHFIDKYELLQYLLTRLLKDLPHTFSDCNDLDTVIGINDFVFRHKKIIKNIIENANESTLELLHNSFEVFISESFGYKTDTFVDTKHLKFLKFCTGGMINLLASQIKNDFPTNAQLLDEDSYNMFKNILEYIFIEQRRQLKQK